MLAGFASVTGETIKEDVFFYNKGAGWVKKIDTSNVQWGELKVLNISAPKMNALETVSFSITFDQPLSNKALLHINASPEWLLQVSKQEQPPFVYTAEELQLMQSYGITDSLGECIYFNGKSLSELMLKETEPAQRPGTIMVHIGGSGDMNVMEIYFGGVKEVGGETVDAANKISDLSQEFVFEFKSGLKTVTALETKENFVFRYSPASKHFSRVIEGQISSDTSIASVYYNGYLIEEDGKIPLRGQEFRESLLTVILNDPNSSYEILDQQSHTLVLRVTATGKLHYEFTGDTEILKKNLNRYRMAIQFLLTHPKGESGLLDLSYMPGHDGLSGVGHGIGNGYWDIFSTPPVSFYSNIYFYRALESMAFLEEAAEILSLNIQKPVVAGSDNQSAVPYTQDSESLYQLAAEVKENIRKNVSEGGFWDENKGRFVEGVVNGNIIDYGFVNFNLEAIASGIPTAEQSAKILDWINGDRIVEEDSEAGERNYASGKFGNYSEETGEGNYGIYDFEFAPRTTTVKNYHQYNWEWGGTTAFGEQVQDGGVVMFTSYYDILSRLENRGADDAFGRLKEIQAWYNKVERVAKQQGVGTDLPNDQFYRVYYDELGLPIQGDNVAGGIGLDSEFLESAVLYATVAFGFFGLGGTADGCLRIAPQLPANLDFWKMENLLYRNVRYDLIIGKDYVQFESVRGVTAGRYAEIVFPLRENYRITCDGDRSAEKSNSCRRGYIDCQGAFPRAKG